MSDTELTTALEVARAAVEAASRAALPHWRSGVRVEKKADRTPVTAADRASEEAILAIIRARFPGHAILAEESGAHAGEAAHRWIVDPLDGTRGFSRGGVYWGALVAYEREGEVVAGAMALPALDEVYWAAKGRGCFRNGERVRVSAVSDLEEATLSVGELGQLLRPPFEAGMLRLIRAAASTRGYGDPGGAAMLLSGRADAWLEAGVKVWDIAPQKILVEEAGGRFTSLTGQASIELGHCLASNGLLHAPLLAALAGEDGAAAGIR